MDKKISRLVERAARNILRNKCLLITSGAGMGKDSGLPVFRGDKGLWENYPFLKKHNLRFTDAACQDFFHSSPAHYWYFYGHRYNIYKEKSPHYGFHRLLKLAERVKEGNYFCVTSNVDGHFQRAGFPNKKISEIHGSISHYQCNKCRIILPFEIDKFELDHQQSICLNLPKCKYCNSIVRPNILMFGDMEWDSKITDEQDQNFSVFQNNTRQQSKSIIEIGAGIAVPSIRYLGESYIIKEKYRAALIRINPVQELHSYHRVRDELNEIRAEDLKDAEIKQMHDHSKKEMEKSAIEEEAYYKNLRNEIIAIETGGLDGINMLCDKIEELSGVDLK